MPPGGESTATGPAETRTLAGGTPDTSKSASSARAGVPASVGVAPNMSTAKIASDADKPDGLVVVPPGEVESFLASLPTAEIHGVGPVTERTLAELGIETAGDLAAADPDRLADELGDRGRELYRRARGDDDREVTPTGLPKSLAGVVAVGDRRRGAQARETVRARRRRGPSCPREGLSVPHHRDQGGRTSLLRGEHSRPEPPRSGRRPRPRGVGGARPSASSPVTESVSSGCASRNSTSPRAIRRRSAGSTRGGRGGTAGDSGADRDRESRPSQSPPTARAGSSPPTGGGGEAERRGRGRGGRDRRPTDERDRRRTDRHRSATGRERWRDLLRIRGEHSPPSAGI